MLHHRMATRRVLTLVWLGFSPLWFAASVEPPASLGIGQTVSLRIDASHAATIALESEGNESFDLTFSQDEPSLEFRVSADGDQQIEPLRSGYPGLVFFSFPVRSKKQYHLTISVPKALESSVFVTVSSHPGVKQGRQLTACMQAERTFAKAQAMRAEPTAAGLKQSIYGYQQAAALWLEGQSLQGRALALTAEAQVWFQLSRYTDALRAFSAAEAIVEPNSRQQVYVQSAKAELHLELWQRETALQLANRSLEISRRIQDVPGEANALANQAIANFLLSQRDARSDLQHALMFAEAAGNRVAAARILGVQGWLERDLGHLGESIENLRRSSQLFQETGRRIDAISEMCDIASTESMKGDPYSAIVRHLRMAKLFHDVGAAYQEANALTGVGQDYLAVHRLQDALQYFRDSKRLFARIGNPWGVYAVLGLMCSSELKLHRVNDAQADCQEAKRLAVDLHSLPNVAVADWHLGMLAESRNQGEQALAYYTQSAAISADEHYPLGEASAVVRIGLLKYKDRSFAEAIELFHRALVLSQTAEDLAGTVEARFELARCETETGRLGEAEVELDQAIGIFESQRFRVKDDKLRTSYFAAARKCYDLYVEILMRMHAADSTHGYDLDALAKSEAARGRTLLEALITRGGAATLSSNRSAAPEVLRLRASLNQAYETRLNLIVQGRNQREVQRNEAAIRRLATMLDEAETLASERFSPLEANVHPLTASELLQVQPDSVILEYSLGEKLSYLWRIEHGRLKSFLLPNRKTITKAVDEWREFASARQHRANEPFAAHQLRIKTADRDLPRRSASLSCMLLAGLNPSQNGRMIVIADGSLQALPFAALPLNGCHRQDGPPLLTAYEVLYTPSLSVFRAGAATRTSLSTSRGVAILADPVFSAHDARVTERFATKSAPALSPLQTALRDVGLTAELLRLPGTQREADAIAAAAPPSTKVLKATGFKATLELALSPDLSQYPIWHFATHGLLDAKSPELSGIVFSLVDEKGHPTPGYLKIRDIFGLSIHPDLVVLSACSSGLGEQVDGEGTVGLSYAFLHAGAKLVVSTLWNVEDQVSGDLISEFYQGLLKEKLSPAAALRKAQNNIRLKMPNAGPFYWAGFVITSN